MTLTVSRRAFLRTAAVSTLGLPLLLEACGGASSSPASSGVPAGSAAAAASKLQMPSYVPFNGPKPDMPGTSTGVPPAYTSFPKDLIKTVSAPPGKGDTVTATAFILGAPPTPMDQNAAWQQVNKELGVTFQMSPVSVADYFPTKLPTILASGNLPDIFLESAQGSTIQNEPDFLASQCSDLTPYLSGDNVKAFPNLANLPAYAWTNMVFNGKIFGVPLARGGIAGINGTSMLAKGKLFDAANIPYTFNNTDDFTKAMKELTIPGKQYGMGGSGTADPAKWFLQIYGAPNVWRNDGGKLTKDWETPEYKAAVAYMRSLWDAGYIHPDTPSMSGAQVGAGWYQGNYALWPNSFIAWVLAWNSAIAADKDFKPRVLTPFSADGKVKPVYHQGGGFAGRTVLKKSDPDRIKELLGILNYLAAPFGSQEQLLLTYGVQGTDFQFDDKGNPKTTQKGAADVNVGWAQLATMPDVLYDALDSNFAPEAYKEEQASYAMALPNPTVGLYSKTWADKSQALNMKMADGVTQIVYGRAPVSTLDGLVKDWQSSGGNQMRTEYQDALQAAGK
jgi:putative aldouronate transport system substrate-binding protein